MRNDPKLSEAAQNATIERSEFDAVMKKLLRAKPITKQNVSTRIKNARRGFSSAAKRSGQP